MAKSLTDEVEHAGSIGAALQILARRIEELERRSGMPSSTIDKREEWQLKR